MVDFSQTTYSTNESSGNVSIMLSLKGGTSDIDITVTVMPSDQSAEGKFISCDDYLVLTVQVMEWTTILLLSLQPSLLELIILRLMYQ